MGDIADSVLRGLSFSYEQRHRNDQNSFFVLWNLTYRFSAEKKKLTIRINLSVPSFHLESTVIMKCYITSSYKTQQVTVYIRAPLEKVSSMARQLEEVK